MPENIYNFNKDHLHTFAALIPIQMALLGSSMRFNLFPALGYWNGVGLVEGWYPISKVQHWWVYWIVTYFFVSGAHATAQKIALKLKPAAYGDKAKVEAKPEESKEQQPAPVLQKSVKPDVANQKKS